MSATIIYSAAKTLHYNGHEWRVYELDSNAWYRPGEQEIKQILNDPANRDRKV